MPQQYCRAIWGMGVPSNLTPPAAHGSIDGLDRRHLAGLFRGHPDANLRRCVLAIGWPVNELPPIPDGSITDGGADGSDLRHLAGFWRRTRRHALLPWHLFFGRSI